MKYKHFCHVDPQEPNITLVGLFIIQRVQVYLWSALSQLISISLFLEGEGGWELA